MSWYSWVPKLPHNHKAKPCHSPLISGKTEVQRTRILFPCWCEITISHSGGLTSQSCLCSPVCQHVLSLPIPQGIGDTLC
jgi:hypothetical protein